MELNPDYNVVQVKILIPHAIFIQYKEMPVNTPVQEKEAKDFLKYHTKGKEWFTTQSPYFFAITTGIINCNGEHRVLISKN